MTLEQCTEREDDEEGISKDAVVSGERSSATSAIAAPSTVTREALDRLHAGSMPSVTGNLDTDNNFREWHEVVYAPSYMSQPLNLLPYVLLDF